MPTTYVPLSFGFSTADAEYPELEYRQGDLVVRFSDWREKPITLRFPDAAAFRWQDEADLPDEVRDDTPYEVMNSSWLAELQSLGAAPKDPHHYMLCFNAAGVLDLVSGPLAVEE